MQRVRGTELFEHARRLHREGNLDAAERVYHQLLNHNLNHPDFVLQLAQIHAQRGEHGLAIVLYKHILDERPELGKIWNNLGISLKLLHYNESADFAFRQAIEREPENVDFLSNISSCFVNDGQPDKIIEWADKAIALGPEDHAGVVQARWHKALGLLEQKLYDPGWDYAEARLAPNSGCKIDVRNYAGEGMTPWWDGKSPGLVAIHGEQGLGDEIMFASCIPDAVKTGAEIVIECAPRLYDLFARSFPTCQVVGTHQLHGEGWLGNRQVDYKLAFGTLAKFYRRAEKDFPGAPYLIPDPRLSRHYAERLQAMGPRPKIGIAWQGGVIKTRVELRSVSLSQLAPILAQDADFISLQYTAAAEKEIGEFTRESGVMIHHWPEAAQGLDMDHQAALISQLDLVITVCQTAVHVAGGLGVPAIVLVPSKPSWRYGNEGGLPWYRSVELIRQVGDDWTPVIEKAQCSLQKLIENSKKNFIGPTRVTA